MLGERGESERAFSGRAANGWKGIARRRSIPGSSLRDSRRWTETGRTRGEDGLLVWQQTQSANGERERAAGAAGTNSRRARKTRLQHCHVDPPRRAVFRAPPRAQARLQQSTTDTLLLRYAAVRLFSHAGP